MSVTLTLVDNAGVPTGAVATIAGSTGGTVSVFTLQVSSELQGNDVVAGGKPHRQPARLRSRCRPGATSPMPWTCCNRLALFFACASTNQLTSVLARVIGGITATLQMLSFPWVANIIESQFGQPLPTMERTPADP